MIKKLEVYASSSFDARFNQAVEAALLDTATQGAMILYLWANDNAVFIGRNQNARLECDIEALERGGGVLCRRLTGGGAVYHDKGNVNFTFILPGAHYDEKRQFEIVLKAIQNKGITAELGGRNDILVNGRKCSGSAYYKSGEFFLHHGTVLLTADYEKISRYLTVGKLKLKAKGVDSVAQRVINLGEFFDVTREDMFTELVSAAESVTGLKSAMRVMEDIDAAAIRTRLEFFSEPRWLYGDDIYYDARIEHRFEWGTADIRLKMNGNIITEARIYSDALDTDALEEKERALKGEDIYNTKSEAAKDIIEVYNLAIG